MLELSLHILDIVENSVRAEADIIHIIINEDTKNDLFSIKIIDNGNGMDETVLNKALDPFTTTKHCKKVGLGLSFLKEAAERCEGKMKIYSSPEKGTEIQADFIRSHIDRQPLGDIIETLVVLVTGYPEVEFVLNHNKDEKQVHWETSEINKYFGNIMRCSAKVIQFIKKELSERYKDFNE